MTTIYFDEIAYLQEARKAGISQDAAEVQAKYIRIAVNEAVKTAHDELSQRDLVTKQDLQVAKKELELKIEQVRANLEVKIEQVRKEIEQSKNNLILWFFSLSTAYGGALIGIMGHGFHWW